MIGANDAFTSPNVSSCTRVFEWDTTLMKKIRPTVVACGSDIFLESEIDLFQMEFLLQRRNFFIT